MASSSAARRVSLVRSARHSASESPSADPTVEATEEATSEPTEEITSEPTPEITDEPTVEIKVGNGAIYLTDNDKRVGFRSFYKIGNRVFGNIDEDVVLADIRYKQKQRKTVFS